MPQQTKPPRQQRPKQSQRRQPGVEHRMIPEPEVIRPGYKGAGRLAGKVALITGGDSGIGRAVAVAFAREGARIAVVYLNEHKDARDTARLIEEEGSQALLIAADLGKEKACAEAVKRTVKTFGSLNILVNNAALQFP